MQRATSSPSRYKLPPDLADAIDPKFSSKTRRIFRLSAASRLARAGSLFGIGAPGDMSVIGRRGDRQHPADRLDPMGPAMIVDEGDHGLNRRSSSAWAKYALALRRISLAWRSSRFSRSSAFSFARHVRRRPGPCPLSRSAFFDPVVQRLRRAADLRRNRHDRRPLRGMIALVIDHHPHRALAHLRRKLVRRLACHGSILSRVGASGKPGAVQSALYCASAPCWNATLSN